MIGSREFKRIIQRDDHSCGPCCISSILSFFGKQVHYNDVYEGCLTTNNGTSALFMCLYLRSQGLKVSIDARMTLTALTKALRRGCAIIAFTRDPKVGAHFEVVYGRTSKFIYLSDPNPDTIGTKISLKNFLRKFDNWGMVVSQ